MSITIPPPTIDDDVWRLCQHLKIDGEPRYVSVQTRRDARMQNCYAAVARQVAERGGASVVGWVIWLVPGIMIEAEHHAVWRQPDGELLDVALHPDGEQQVLFLVDPDGTVPPRGRDNVRLALGDDPDVPRLIEVLARHFVLQQQAEASRSRAVPPELLALERERDTLMPRILRNRMLKQRAESGGAA